VFGDVVFEISLRLLRVLASDFGGFVQPLILGETNDSYLILEFADRLDVRIGGFPAGDQEGLPYGASFCHAVMVSRHDTWLNSTIVGYRPFAWSALTALSRIPLIAKDQLY
jgi:hypothetical protein